MDGNFSRRAKDVLIRSIFSPQAGALVATVPMGPERWGPHSEEWVVHLTYPVGDPRAHSDALVEADARNALGIPDFPWKIHRITPVIGRGDDGLRVPRRPGVPARRRCAPPPTHRRARIDQRDPRRAEPGLEARIVLAGAAASYLLDTYEAERRPVDQRNAQRSLENVLNHLGIGTALGVSHENSPEQNMAHLRRMWSGQPPDAEHRSRALRTMRAQSMEFG